MENGMGKKKKMENNGENSGPLRSLPVDRLTATDRNAAAWANRPYKRQIDLTQNPPI